MLSPTFKALSDPTRREILRLLAACVFSIVISYVFWRQEQARPRPPADDSPADPSH